LDAPQIPQPKGRLRSPRQRKVPEK
jgi:hypothetical protein